MGDYGLKIVKPGYDITSNNIDELVFSSAYNTFKIKDAQTGTWTVTSGNKFGSKTITLTGYITQPFYAIFIEVNDKNYYVNNGGYIEAVDGVNDLFLYTFIDDSIPPVLYIYADPNANPTFAETRDLNYYLYLGIDDI